MTTAFEGSFPNFNVVYKADKGYHSSLLDIVDKEKSNWVKK